MAALQGLEVTYIVVGAELLSDLCPGIKVVLRRNVAPNSFLRPDRPVLVESRSSQNRGLVDTLRLIYVVCAPVALDRSLLRGTGRRIVRAKAFDYVVLDEGLG